MRIEIVTTPNERLKETGFGTLKACKSVRDSVQRIGHRVALNVCKNEADLEEIANRKPDLVILAVKYVPVENNADIWPADYFSRREINFSGSPKEILEFDSNKVLAKSFLRDKGINTAGFFTAIPDQFERESDLPIGFPLFLKPSDAANGNGIDDSSLVRDFASFEAKVLSLYRSFGLPALAEEYLDGREFTASVIETPSDGLLVSPIEIVPPESENGLRILGEKAKTDNFEELRKIEEPEIKQKVRTLALDVFRNLGASDLGRIDIKSDKGGNFFFMEANLVPGMTRGSSYFPRACEIENDLPYDNVIELLVEKGLSRVSAAASAGKTQ